MLSTDKLGRATELGICTFFNPGACSFFPDCSRATKPEEVLEPGIESTLVAERIFGMCTSDISLEGGTLFLSSSNDTSPREL